MKQTAVEWLFEQYKLIGMVTTAQVEKAKRMEKEQIKDAFVVHYTGTAEQYYNETFNNNEK